MATNYDQMQLTSDQLFEQRYLNECRQVHRFMLMLMIAQWIGGIAFALFYSPLTWIGQFYEIHIHVWASILLGGSISGFAILWIRSFPDAAHTRHVVAVTQMLWSALLIHLSGGRIETHFHVFASLAILSIYRDWKILITAAAVVAVDHFIRGVYYPLSAFGIITESPYRWIEHAAWVVFEISFLVPGCKRLRNELKELCIRQVEIRQAKESVDRKVSERTKELELANRLLAEKTIEAEKLALVARHTDNAVVITDENHRIDWVNSAFTRINGYELEEVIGRKQSEFRFGPKTNAEFKDQLTVAIQGNEGFDTEVVLYKKNGESYWASVELCPIRNDAGKLTHLMSVERDISEKTQAESERQKLNEQLVNASRTAGKAEVATGVLHNVGNTLNSINVSMSVIRNLEKKSAFTKLERAADLITENLTNFGSFVQSDERGQKLPPYLVKLVAALRSEKEQFSAEFDDMGKNIEHIKEIVSMQQTMARCAGVKQHLHPAELINDLLTATKGSLTNHCIKITQRIQENLPIINSDKHKILQILINLVRNSKDALVDFGASEPTIELSVTANDRFVQYRISDNGLGIASDQLHSVFQHGYTTKEAGHGFGLHSSANAANELGGQLFAESEGIGRGATFTLRIPLAEKKSQMNSVLETSASN